MTTAERCSNCVCRRLFVNGVRIVSVERWHAISRPDKPWRDENGAVEMSMRTCIGCCTSRCEVRA